MRTINWSLIVDGSRDTKTITDQDNIREKCSPHVRLGLMQGCTLAPSKPMKIPNGYMGFLNIDNGRIKTFGVLKNIDDVHTLRGFNTHEYNDFSATLLLRDDITSIPKQSDKITVTIDGSDYEGCCFEFKEEQLVIDGNIIEVQSILNSI